MTTVSDLTESELIGRIKTHLPPPPGWLIVGIGDDAAVVEPERNRLEVLSVDALVEGVHFDRRFTPPGAIGHRALAVNLSDLAAMGAAPRLALLSFALPGDLSCGDFDAIVAGLTALSAHHRMHVVGGNLARSTGPLMIDVTVVGSVKPRQALTRSGARPGDELYVTGSIGAAAAGLQMLKDGFATKDTTDTKEHLSTEKTSSTSVSLVSSVVKDCMNRYLYPEPRVRLGLLLARNRAASACVDLSDGLADGVWRVAEASGVGAAIDGAALPIDPTTRGWFDSRGADPILESVTGGDDYELVFTARPRLRGRLKAATRHGGAPLTRIGVCTENPAVVLRRTIGEAVVDSPMPRGYSHFR
jgi:thiamine-monophosphate kinase